MARWMMEAEDDEAAAAAALEASLVAVLESMMIVIFGYVMDRIRCLCYGRTDNGLWIIGARDAQCMRRWRPAAFLV